VTIEFLAVANLVPALTAFYGSIDQLKHRKFRSSDPPKLMLLRHMPLNTVSPSQAMKKPKITHFSPIGEMQPQTINRIEISNNHENGIRASPRSTY